MKYSRSMHDRTRPWIVRGILLALCPWIPLLVSAQTEVYLGVKAQAVKKIPLILQASVLDSADREMARATQVVMEVLGEDLRSSGVFHVWEPDTTREEGKNPGQRALFRMAAHRDGGPICMTGTLLDFARQQLLLAKDYTPGDQLRWTAHQMNDDIVYALTGHRGAASTKIAFVSTRSGHKELYVMDYDGYSQRQLTYDRTIALFPAWSPDGTSLIYSSYRSMNWDLYIVQLATRKIMPLATYPGLNITPAWSPEGTQIAFMLTKDGNAEVYTADPSGDQLRRLTYSPGIDSAPCWSPDGRYIAFTSDRTGINQIYVMDLTGATPRRLTWDEGIYEDSPAWSPRGDRIAFVRRGPLGFDIFISDPYGQNIVQLTKDNGSNEDPCWSPNGLHIVFSSNRRGPTHIYTMNWDGSDQRRLTEFGENMSPAWSPFMVDDQTGQ